MKLKWDFLENWLTKQVIKNRTIIVREPLSKLKKKNFIKWQDEADKDMEETHGFVAVAVKESKLLAFAINSSFIVETTVCQLADDGYKYNTFLGVYWHYILVSNTSYEVESIKRSFVIIFIQILARRF